MSVSLCSRIYLAFQFLEDIHFAVELNVVITFLTPMVSDFLNFINLIIVYICYFIIDFSRIAWLGF